MYKTNRVIIMLATAYLAVQTSANAAEISSLSGSVQTQVNPVDHARATYRTTAHAHKYRVSHYRTPPTYWQRHPMEKGAAIGAGVGAAGGSIAGLISGRGIVRGAAIGAGTGAGVGVIRTSKTMKEHPIMRDTATGGLAGLGLGWASSRNHSTIGKTAGVGAAAGLGFGLLKDLK